MSPPMSLPRPLSMARENHATAVHKSLLGGILARFTGAPDNCPA